jgi:hypothetical protein
LGTGQAILLHIPRDWKITLPVKTIPSLLHCLTFFSCIAHPRPRSSIAIYIVAFKPQPRPSPQALHFALPHLLIGLSDLQYSWFIGKLSSRSFFWCIHFDCCTDGSKVIDRQTILAGSLSLASIWKQDFKLKPIDTLIAFAFNLLISFWQTSKDALRVSGQQIKQASV